MKANFISIPSTDRNVFYEKMIRLAKERCERTAIWKIYNLLDEKELGHLKREFLSRLILKPTKVALAINPNLPLIYTGI